MKCPGSRAEGLARVQSCWPKFFRSNQSVSKTNLSMTAAHDESKLIAVVILLLQLIQGEWRLKAVGDDIKRFSFLATVRQNKLECLSWQVFSG
jgi:hypothetical protein